MPAPSDTAAAAAERVRLLFSELNAACREAADRGLYVDFQWTAQRVSDDRPPAVRFDVQVRRDA